MELSQIRYFVTLAGALNFTRAAEACHVTQPALTRAIQKLEDELGGQLFYRERQFTQLTELGRLMLPMLEQAQHAAMAAKQQAAAFRRRETSPLNLGLEACLSASLLTPVLAEVLRHAPELDLTLREESSAVLCERLLEGEIEAVVLVETDRLPDRLHRWPLFRERYVVILPPDAASAAPGEVPITALAEHVVLLPAVEGCTLRAALDRLCAEAGLVPRVRSPAGSTAQLHEMIKAGFGVGLSGERQPVAPPLVTRPLGGPDNQRTVLLAAAAGRPYGPTLSSFLKLMRARAWDAERPAEAAGYGNHAAR